MLNPAAFAAPRGLTFGNAGRNVLNNPHRTNFDMSLLKHITLPHERGLEFRAEAFNVFNHTQFRIYDPSQGNTPSNTVSCYAGPDAGYSAAGGGGTNCYTGYGFLHPFNAHRAAWPEVHLLKLSLSPRPQQQGNEFRTITMDANNGSTAFLPEGTCRIVLSPARGKRLNCGMRVVGCAQEHARAQRKLGHCRHPEEQPARPPAQSNANQYAGVDITGGGISLNLNVSHPNNAYTYQQRQGIGSNTPGPNSGGLFTPVGDFEFLSDTLQSPYQSYGAQFLYSSTSTGTTCPAGTTYVAGIYCSSPAVAMVGLHDGKYVVLVTGLNQAASGAPSVLILVQD